MWSYISPEPRIPQDHHVGDTTSVGRARQLVGEKPNGYDGSSGSAGGQVAPRTNSRAMRR